jgi:Domain of unknown function (DUF4160)
MPEISRFFGIIILLYYNDHNPPHFHVRYGDQRAILEIATLTILEGSLKPRVLGLVIEWAAMHKGEIMEDWERARRQEPLEKITPLE